MGSRVTMKKTFRVVTWNCRCATAENRRLWDYLLKLDPDIALLQEVGGFPDSIRSRFACDSDYAMGKSGSPSRVRTGLLVKGYIGKAVTLTAPTGRVPPELMRQFSGIFWRDTYYRTTALR